MRDASHRQNMERTIALARDRLRYFCTFIIWPIQDRRVWPAVNVNSFNVLAIRGEYVSFYVDTIEEQRQIISFACTDIGEIQSRDGFYFQDRIRKRIKRDGQLFLPRFMTLL